ncbi:MAG: hypothetical protein HQM10_17230 [Candidatus Riflebacteria bacterium]|nr:hypothetical protein [Candidatus Riflebacteria bacterium]
MMSKKMSVVFMMVVSFVVLSTSVFAAGIIPPYIGNNLIRSDVEKLENLSLEVFDSMSDSFKCRFSADSDNCTIYDNKVFAFALDFENVLSSIEGNVKTFVKIDSRKSEILKSVNTLKRQINEAKSVFMKTIWVIEDGRDYVSQLDILAQVRQEIIHTVKKLDSQTQNLPIPEICF